MAGRTGGTRRWRGNTPGSERRPGMSSCLEASKARAPAHRAGCRAVPPACRSGWYRPRHEPGTRGLRGVWQATLRQGGTVEGARRPSRSPSHAWPRAPSVRYGTSRSSLGGRGRLPYAAHMQCGRLSGPRRLDARGAGRVRLGSIVCCAAARPARRTPAGPSAGCLGLSELECQPGTRKGPGWFVNRSPKITAQRSTVQTWTVPGPGERDASDPGRGTSAKRCPMRPVLRTGPVWLTGWMRLRGNSASSSPLVAFSTRPSKCLPQLSCPLLG